MYCILIFKSIQDHLIKHKGKISEVFLGDKPEK
jgi:hypothetical protein